jgi:hypothetical protein
VNHRIHPTSNLEEVLKHDTDVIDDNRVVIRTKVRIVPTHTSSQFFWKDKVFCCSDLLSFFRIISLPRECLPTAMTPCLFKSLQILLFRSVTFSSPFLFLIIFLKGQCHEIFDFRVFHESVSPGHRCCTLTSEYLRG